MVKAMLSCPDMDSPYMKKGAAPKGGPISVRSRVDRDRACALSPDQGLLTVDAPASHAVPTKRLEAGQLVDDRSTHGVELLRDSLCESLLSSEVRVVHVHGSTCAGVDTDSSTRRLDEDSPLVLADLSGPDVVRRRVLVRWTPCGVTSLGAEVVRDLRVDVRGEEATLVGVHLVGAQLRNSQTYPCRTERVGCGGTYSGLRTVVHRPRSAVVTDVVGSAV